MVHYAKGTRLNRHFRIIPIPEPTLLAIPDGTDTTKVDAEDKREHALLTSDNANVE